MGHAVCIVASLTHAPSHTQLELSIHYPQRGKDWYIHEWLSIHWENKKDRGMHMHISSQCFSHSLFKCKLKSTKKYQVNPFFLWQTHIESVETKIQYMIFVCDIFCVWTLETPCILSGHLHTHTCPGADHSISSCHSASIYTSHQWRLINRGLPRHRPTCLRWRKKR